MTSTVVPYMSAPVLPFQACAPLPLFDSEQTTIHGQAKRFFTDP